MKWATMAVPLALLGLPGCALDGSTTHKPATGAVREIAGVVKRLERASAGADWRTVCDELFTASARRRAGGSDCVRLLRSDAEGIVRPRIEVLRIDVKRSAATVRVRSRARGQPPLDDLIELVRQRGGYRIESLGG